jgi:succinate dehydrogenase flavin-adding protein (antitoxin of CptAB toxin-antitoxin module)
MRELDILLTNYLDNDYPQSGEAQKQAFCELLALPDADLIAYLLGPSSRLIRACGNACSCSPGWP